MAKKKQTFEVCGDAPKTLKNHPFYGLDLDEQQIEFRDAIWNPNNDIIFCNAKAGTGKTVVSLGVANLLVKYGLFDDIIWMINPTKEQAIGYRPGTTEQKIAAYMMPLYDAAASLGINPYMDINICTDDWMQPNGGYITCMTPIFLRGRNIPSSSDKKTILICDESQNMYIDELQTVLTRVNNGAKVIVIGHTGQCDLYHNPERSGFAPFIELFKNKERAQICTLTKNHRSWISEHADTINDFIINTMK